MASKYDDLQVKVAIVGTIAVVAWVYPMWLYLFVTLLFFASMVWASYKSLSYLRTKVVHINRQQQEYQDYVTYDDEPTDVLTRVIQFDDDTLDNFDDGMRQWK